MATSGSGDVTGAKDRVPGRFEALAADVAVGLALLSWATVLSLGTGGRDPGLLSAQAVFVLAALALTRAWRHVPAAVLGACSLFAVAALLVMAVTPIGLAGGGPAGGYVVTAGSVVLFTGWARDRQRRQSLLGAVALFGTFQVAAGWLAWWGGGSPAQPFIGTFYWHNQSGAALVLGSLAGLGLLLEGDAPWSRLGWLAAPLCASFTVFSTSRGAMLFLAVGWTSLIAISVPRRHLRKAVAAMAATAVVFVLMPGPLFFPDNNRGWFGLGGLSGTSQRNDRESLGQNSGFRLTIWEQGLGVFASSPVTGVGYGRFAEVQRELHPSDPAKSLFVHNGVLSLFVAGGVLLGGTATALLSLVLVTARRARKRRPGELDLLTGGVLLLVAVGHSFIDFDWVYPGLLLAVPVVSGVLAGGAVTGPAPRTRAVDLAVVGLCACLLVTVVLARHGVPLILAPGLGLHG